MVLFFRLSLGILPHCCTQDIEPEKFAVPAIPCRTPALANSFEEAGLSNGVPRVEATEETPHHQADTGRTSVSTSLIDWRNRGCRTISPWAAGMTSTTLALPDVYPSQASLAPILD